jgi:hypothetical protein
VDASVDDTPVAIGPHAERLRALHGAHAGEVLERSPVIERVGEALVLTQPVAPAAAPSAEVPRPPGLPELPEPATGALAAPPPPDALRLPLDARDALELSMGQHAPLRVYEEGARGAVERVEGAASYAREGGRSYWTTAEGHGFEEWLELERGLAYADRVVARWRVEGHTLREVPERGGVHVLGADGVPVAYVSAPAAWSASGEAVSARLSVEGGAIALRVDAAGAAVLVDPMWVPTGSMAEARGQFLQGYGAVRLADGRVLVAGGYGSSGFPLASAEVYDPTTSTWSSAGSLEQRFIRFERDHAASASWSCSRFSVAA